ncbi:MAG: DUF1127 domain-containing protein [Rhodospirillales bacterium]
MHELSDAVANDLARLGNQGVVGLIRLWRHRMVTRRSLVAMETRLLADIGLTPEEARREARRPFWQPVRPLLNRR